MKVFFYGCCFLFFFPVRVNCQTAVIDSLKNLLPEAAEDTTRVTLLCDLAFYLHNLDPEESLRYSEQALELARKLHFQNGLANAHYKIGIAKMMLGEYPAAVIAVEQALALATAAHYTRYIENCNNVLGVLYTDLGDHEKALDHLLASVKSAELSRDSQNMATAFLNIGKVYMDNGDQINARKYFSEAVEMYQAIDNKAYLAFAYNSLSTTEEDPEIRENYLLRSMEMAEAAASPYFAAYAYTNYGGFLYVNRKNVPEAIAYIRKGLHTAGRIRDEQLGAQVGYELGQIYLEEGVLDSAAFYFQKGLTITADGTDAALRGKLLVKMAEVNEQRGRYQEAYAAISEAMTIKDELQQKEREKQLASADARYELSKKDAQLAAQQLVLARQQNRQSQIIIGALLLLALTVSLFQYFFYRQRQRKREVEMALSAELAEADRLRQLDDLKNRFFTNVSHELRTPLTLIISPLEEALKQLKQVPLESHLQLAHRNSKRLLGIVNEVLELSKLEAGGIQVQERSFDLIVALRRIFFSFQSVAGLQSIQLDFHAGEVAHYWVSTDLTKLEKILNNLIANAIKFSDSGGSVKLGFCILPDAGEGILITVEDQGRGIRAEELSRIFQRFYQARDSHGRPSEAGTGIGLALASQLAHLLGGELTAESRWGEGSTFRLYLPLSGRERPEGQPDADNRPPRPALPAEQPENEPAVFEPALVNGHKPRLLIVEDHPEMGRYLIDHFSKRYNCTLATNGREALEVMENVPIDLITSDVMMPEMDGFTLRQKINEKENWQHIPFIMLTARGLEEDKIKGFQLGIDDYVTKPFSLAELKARIRNLLRNKQKREHWALETANEPAEEPESSPAEQQIEKAERLVLEKLNDPEFSVAVLAREMALSSRHLSRVLGRQTGLTPVQFILEVRLQKARQLLESGQYLTVAEVQYEIGIESASYFSRKFTARFGKNPKEYLQS